MMTLAEAFEEAERNKNSRSMQALALKRLSTEVKELQGQFHNRAGSFYVAQICQFERKIARYKEALENIAATTCPEMDYTIEDATAVAREALADSL